MEYIKNKMHVYLDRNALALECILQLRKQGLLRDNYISCCAHDYTIDN